jgi:cyclic beta-1,2-glucan synthetase
VISVEAAIDILPRVLSLFRRGGGSADGAIEEPPLRSELLGAEQMEQHGKALAASHVPGPKRSRDLLLARLAQSERVLLRASQLLTAAIREDRPGTPAGEWLLDNFHLIEEQIHTARKHLPKDYSRELPRLRNGPSDGLPRVYDIALEAISHGDGQVDPESFRRFIAAYQSVATLTLGELWAVPIMLRLALIENLRRAASRIIAHRGGLDLADFWASRMTQVAQSEPNSLILAVADMARSNPPMSSAFVAELVRRLQGQNASLAMPLHWIEQRLSELGLSTTQMVQSENQQQAADQVSISNSISSLRLLAATDWHAFVEAMSLAERSLREDPSGEYALMDFATRDHYRHVLEKIARRSGLAEEQVARCCVQLAREAAARDAGDNRAAHVGYYLVGGGLPQLEARVRGRMPAARATRRLHGAALYFGAIALLTAAFTAGLLAQAHAGGARGWLLALFGILAALGASQPALTLVNWLTTLGLPPQPLPRMDFSKGITPACRTLVVVPTLIRCMRDVEDLAEKLEVRFLANRDAVLHFALLTDFADAEQETLPEDGPLLDQAALRIAELNAKYRDTGMAGDEDAFFLFHRPRRWNPRERAWMGHERKRGKLGDLNALLRSGAAAAFSRIVGRTDVLSGVRYVITLDTDTQLPRDAARLLVGTMAHPLNRARHDAATRRVTAGYGILQPRVTVSLTDANRSRYAGLQGDDAGIDPYTRMVSDVYQDLFGEGSFIGKGIYDVDAFELALKGRFPENRILSHDLLEGCYLRSGLSSDVQLYEETPSRYVTDASRRHRWMRGDWQLAGWLRRRVPAAGGGTEANPLSHLSQWKIFDNLRRSLVAPALTALLLLGWGLLPPAGFWTLAVLAALLAPGLIAACVELLRKPRDTVLRQHLAGVLRSAGTRLAQGAFTLACLPYETYLSLDAILRTLVSTLITRRRLLQWTPSQFESAAPAARGGADLLASLRSMWVAPFLSAATALALLQTQSAALAAAAPLLLLWTASPLLAWWLGRPLSHAPPRLAPAQFAFLRIVARRTWSFFENFVGPQEHWLPPDNFQESPGEVLAHRTSPTNMGLALLANLSAYDFGYLPAGRLLERTRQALGTMDRLERHRGHFYNWYDTQSLRPLLPAYVSTVDSGNLAGHLLTLRAGLAALPDQPVLAARWLEGLEDTARTLQDAAPQLAPDAQLRFHQVLDAALAARPASLPAARAVLERLAAASAQILHGLPAGADAQLRAWAHALTRQCQDTLHELALLAPPPGAVLPTIPTLRELAAQGVAPARARTAQIAQLALQAGDMARADYDFLYDEVRHLLAIGYNVTERKCDAGYYDLLASEARFAVFTAIAQGKLPQQSWFALGRLLVGTGNGPALLSWSGSMFEYLMPLIVMPSYDNTLLEESCRVAVRRQIEYGARRGVPWGMSESGYNTFDAARNYQYRAFGVPGLGLNRGLGGDLVIAPYATALALMVDPEAACENLQRLAADGMLGDFGFYEAIDYTPSRLHRAQTHAVVRSFMAHHQAMSLLSLAHLLLEQPMQRRFVSDPQFQATLLLLQERVPKTNAFYLSQPERVDPRAAAEPLEPPMRVYNSPDTPNPAVQLLSNGRYHVMVTNAGGGYSRWKDIAVTRWREDATRDPWGTFCYVRDVDSGQFWSSTFQPTLRRPETFEAVFTEQRVEFRRHDAEIDTHTEIVVSPEDDIELRRVRITNRSRTRRTVEVTSYAEAVLAPAAADALHPAFSNLFVQTEIVHARQTILCTRRPRSLGEAAPWMLHRMALHGAEATQVSYETDRARFIGRGHSVSEPQALREGGALSGSEGSVLDPIVAIRQRFALDPLQTATLDLVTGIGENRAACLHLAEKYQDRHLADRAVEMAWTHSQVALRQINVTEADAQLYGRLASSILYANASLRIEAGVIARNRRGQSGLWGYAISGDLPIVLVQLKDPANIELVRQLVQAHAYWRLKGLAVDLVIWNEDRGGYRQQLHEQIMGLIAAGVEAGVVDRPGGIFVRSADQISNEDRILLQSVARAVFTDERGSLADQVRRRATVEPVIPRFVAASVRGAEPARPAAAEARELLLFNGLGGFTPDGREYVITTTPQQATPAPWVNVLANPHFGSVVSESGAAYTWHANAHEFRLTPWHNDAVSDASGEAYYLRDEDTGHTWSPCALPCPGTGDYVTRHGFGYSVFEHSEDGVETELTVYVALDMPVKFAVLRVRNASGRPRRLSATGYVEWVLGDLRQKSSMHVVTEIDPGSGALLARNAYNPEFAEQVAFFDVDDVTRTVSGDRNEFIGRNGTLRNPAALARARLSGKVGAAMDPCAAIQVPFDLAGGATRTLIFRLGVGHGADDASRLAQRLRRSGAARMALDAVNQYWLRTLGAVQIETPDRSLDVLCNGWLLYQTMASRLWGRSGHYQSGGAFGFRDQLQDVMALVHAAPQQVRAHLLLCASRQFPEGDVQHWWHPPSGRGVRTHCSDDYLWLPLATCRYVQATGDSGVLQEQVQFLDGRVVNAGEDSYYDLPLRSGHSATLYQHCVRAVQRGLGFGAHGLPLMGSGDWNDGMNLVGLHGKGESVWLGFFLHQVLTQFARLARLANDAPFAKRCELEASRLRLNLEEHGWDGGWYRRAYFDDGTPLGSASSAECQIDSIAQSWSVLSGAAEPGRARTAMDALDRRLVRREHALIQLLDPPFDKSGLDPGYIRGYVPGVRENGGQYTHAAIWASMAFAAQGDAERAWELLGMINPLRHGASPGATQRYKVEPYVVAADVYAVAPHTGRGGWTWYTGSAGWLYRLITESLLGLQVTAERMRFAPCLPADWQGFRMRYRFRETPYRIHVLQSADAGAEISVSVDGVVQPEPEFALCDDHQEHQVEVRLRPRTRGGMCDGAPNEARDAPTIL